ncbi:hypothetical protein E2I00_014557, partial [Balaenoptera physalus]
SRERDSTERDGSEPRDEGGGRRRPAPDLDLQRRAGSGTGVGAMLARGSASPHKSSPQPLESYKYFPSSLSPVTPSESLPRPRRPLPTQQQPQPSQKLGRIREDEGAVASAAVKEPPEATATPEPLSDEDLPLDPDLYQDFCAGAFDDHGLKEERYKRHRQKQKHKDKWKHPERADAKDPASLPHRIYEILPQRIQQWQQSPCIAEEHGKKLLERIRREQQSARTRLQEMERRFHELEAIILRAKQQAVREDEESNEGDSDDTDLQIFCVSCGHPINPRVALRHMERCYAKYESQTSFGSMYPTRIE